MALIQPPASRPNIALPRFEALTGFRRASTVWGVALLMFTGCSPSNGDRSPPAVESAIESPTDERNLTPGAASEDQASRAEPAPTCAPPEGPLGDDVSLDGRAGAYHLTMVEIQGVDGSPARMVEGSLTLFPQEERLRQFAGSAGGPIPGVTSPLFGSTDVDLEDVGAVRVGSLSSEDPDAPGVLVIESETGAGPSILLRLGSEANRRDIVRFDGGYTVLSVVEVTGDSFGGTWSSGARGPESEGFFCAWPTP